MNWGWTASFAAGERVMDAFLAAGGNFIDSADIYSNWVKGFKGGESETVIGRWMKTRKNRRKIVLATKARGRMWDGPTGEGLNRAHLIQACDDSLKRLQTDCIDLYQMHWYDDATPIEETLRALGDLVKAGKIRYIGASNYSAGQLVEACAISRALGLPQFVSLQPFYNLFGRDIEKDHVWVMQKYKVS